jgi:type II secretory pathway pseudopilin PulG
MPMKTSRNDRGFSLVELLVATTTMVVVVGGAVAVTLQVQNGYRRQLEDSAAEQEGRYALDWIGRYLRSASNDPYGKGGTPLNPGLTPCPAAGKVIRGIEFDPNLDGEDNDVRLMTDANPPDGLFGGAAGACVQANEDVTIRMGDPDAGEDPNTIVFLDNNTGGAVQTRTDTVIEDLTFVFRDSARAVIDTTVPANAANVSYVDTRIRIRTRTLDGMTGQPMTRTLSSEVKVRSR